MSHIEYMERRNTEGLYWDARDQRMHYLPGREPKIEHDRCTDEQRKVVEFEPDEDPFVIDWT